MDKLQKFLILHHVVELHVVTIELSQATGRVRWKTLDSLPVNHPKPAGGQREFYCISVAWYICIMYLHIYHLSMKDWYMNPLIMFFSCWGKNLSPWYYIPRDDSPMNVEHLEEWQFTGEYRSNHSCIIITSYIDCVGIEPGPLQSEKPQFFQKYGGRLKIQGARIAIEGKVHAEDWQILGPSVENVVALASLRLGFVILWPDLWCGKATDICSAL